MAGTSPSLAPDATGPPDVAAAGDDAGLTQRELLMEMREDIKGLRATVDAIARDQALGVERRVAMQRSADSIYTRLDGHDRDLDRMLAWQNRADRALVLARWALGASLLAGGRRAPGPRHRRPCDERRHLSDATTSPPTASAPCPTSPTSATTRCPRSTPPRA